MGGGADVWEENASNLTMDEKRDFSSCMRGLYTYVTDRYYLHDHG